MDNFLVFLLLFSMPSVSFGKKLKRLENRLANIEARQDVDSIRRREDFSDLSQRLNDVENLVNSSLTGLSVSGLQSEDAAGIANPGGTVSEVDMSLVDDMLRVKSAFADEKARLRRQASDMEHSIEVGQNDLSSLVKTVKHELVLEVSKMMTELKQDMTSEMQRSMNTVKNELESVGKMMTELKQDMTSEMQSSMNTVKNELESVGKMMTELKQDMTSEMQSPINTVNELVTEVSKMMTELKQEMASDKDVENVEDTCDTLQSIVQDTSLKCSKLPLILDTLSNIENVIMKYSSCLELYKSGERVSGAYNIVLAKNSTPIRVYCDMEIDGGGWTVFQRRQDGSEDFFRGWDDYAAGFGDVEREFWLGNDYISEMTRQCCHELRVDMEYFEGNSAYAKYGRFKVFPRGDDYKLDVGEYSGNASDALAYHSGYKFSTKDKDNDGTSGNCAHSCQGAWWYNACHHSNLNGLYLGEGITSSRGINWENWKNNYQSLKKVEMKFRKI